MKNLISRGISKAFSRARPQQSETSKADPVDDIGIPVQRDPFKILSHCLSIDLEVDPRRAQIFAFAAVPEDEGEGVVHRKGDLEAALKKLDLYSVGFTHVIGHNILRHDLPHLMAVSPRFAKCADGAIDTLWLNPLAFPRNPYHRLVKHYHDGRLQSGHINDPEFDARLVFKVFRNQIEAFVSLNGSSPETIMAYHWLCCRGPGRDGFDRLFSNVRGAPIPTEAEAHRAIQELLQGAACGAQVNDVLARLSDTELGWPMAYALAWISVAGGDSVMPPWVRAQFRDAARLVRDLRDTNCRNPHCAYCAEHNDPSRALERWFGFPSFRPEPADENGRPLQEKIVATAMAGDHLLGILPTGTGKSICYQIPALSRFDKTGALTVVISPLVALMADQVQGLVRAGISSDSSSRRSSGIVRPRLPGISSRLWPTLWPGRARAG
mgnify:FL=1